MKQKGVPSIRWETLKVQKELVEAIDDFIGRTDVNGVRLFGSRADFVKEACLDYLSRKGKLVKNAGEEILVTRK